MPWKEAGVMDLRIEFALRAMRGEVSFVALCREYGISAKTGYKWKERFLEEGLAGLEERSRRPRSSPRQAGEDVVCELVRVKGAHLTWGPRKVREVYVRRHGVEGAPSVSTVKRVLGKSGLVEHRRRRAQVGCGRIENRVEAGGPNEVWTVDFKGWWYSAERRRVEPLTVRDEYSRYVLCAQAMGDSRLETVRRRFDGLFETYGLPGTMRSDNGTPFASVRAPLGLTRLSAWWVALGINLDRIRPGHPEENGGHERMHRDIAMEVEGAVDGDMRRQQAALETWRETFNHERPHEALGMRVPGDVYVKSSRRYEGGEVELEYPGEYLRRRVSAQGEIKVANRRIGISEAVAGWDVGLKENGPGQYTVWFGPLCLGGIELETESFVAAR